MEFTKKEILAQIKKRVEQVESGSDVFLFGSQAREDAREDSDWDILILTSSKSNIKKEQRFRHELFYLELEYEVAFSTFVYSRQDWNKKYAETPLYNSIKKEGIRL